jgi:hypothetical protein
MCCLDKIAKCEEDVKVAVGDLYLNTYLVFTNGHPGDVKKRHGSNGSVE